MSPDPFCGWDLGTRLPGLLHQKHNTTQHCTAYLKERIFVEVDWFQENITIMTLGLASTAVGEVRGREGHTTFIGRDAQNLNRYGGI